MAYINVSALSKAGYSVSTTKGVTTVTNNSTGQSAPVSGSTITTSSVPTSIRSSSGSSSSTPSVVAPTPSVPIFSMAEVLPMSVANPTIKLMPGGYEDAGTGKPGTGRSVLKPGVTQTDVDKMNTERITYQEPQTGVYTIDKPKGQSLKSGGYVSFQGQPLETREQAQADVNKYKSDASIQADIQKYNTIQEAMRRKTESTKTFYQKLIPGSGFGSRIVEGALTLPSSLTTGTVGMGLSSYYGAKISYKSMKDPEMSKAISKEPIKYDVWGATKESAKQFDPRVPENWANIALVAYPFLKSGKLGGVGFESETIGNTKVLGVTRTQGQGTPIAYITRGTKTKVGLGTPKFVEPKLVEGKIQAISQPTTGTGAKVFKTNIDTIITKPSKMLVEGKEVPVEITRDYTVKALESTFELRNVKSKVIQPETFKQGTRTMTPGEATAIYEGVGKTKGTLFGSYPTKSQLKPSLTREIGDIEALYNTGSEMALKSKTKFILEYTQKKNPQSKLRVNPDEPYHIEKEIGGKWEKIAEFKGKGIGEGDVVPERAYGYEMFSKKDYMKYEGVNQAMLRGELKRKTAASLGTKEPGTVGVAHEGRFKDVPDLYRITEQLRENAGGNLPRSKAFLETSKKIGVDYKAKNIENMKYKIGSAKTPKYKLPLSVVPSSISRYVSPRSPYTSPKSPISSPSPYTSPKSPYVSPRSPYVSPKSPSPSPISPRSPYVSPRSPYISPRSPYMSPYSPQPPVERIKPLPPLGWGALPRGNSWPKGMRGQATWTIGNKLKDLSLGGSTSLRGKL